MLAPLLQQLNVSSVGGEGYGIPHLDLTAETGSVLFSEVFPARYADLQNLIFPGLQQLGLHVTEHTQQPEQAAAIWQISFCMDAVPLLTPPEPPEPVRKGEPFQPVWLDTNPHIWWEGDQQHALQRWLTVEKASRPQPRASRIGPMLLRWCAFEAARRHHSHRMVPGGPIAADCLEQMAGKQSAPVFVRMRRAATAMRNAHNRDAWRELTDAVCLQLYIPSGLHAALLCPPEERLTPVHRRELIYAARSSTFCLRAMAAARLSAAAANYEVLRTLEQLLYDENAWVRSAVGPLSKRP